VRPGERERGKEKERERALEPHDPRDDGRVTPREAVDLVDIGAALDGAVAGRS